VAAELIELLYLVLRFSNVLRSRADAGLNIPRLGHDVYQVLLPFLEGESTGLPGESRDDYGILGRGALPLLQNLKSHSMTAGLR